MRLTHPSAALCRTRVGGWFCVGMDRGVGHMVIRVGRVSPVAKVR
jgi:hypothetical protein